MPGVETTRERLGAAMVQRQGPRANTPVPLPLCSAGPLPMGQPPGAVPGVPPPSRWPVGVKWEPPRFPMGLPVCPGTRTMPHPLPIS